MLNELRQKMALCTYLTRMEFERRFAGSFGGRIWVFVGPLMTIFVIWAALSLGLGLRTTVGPGYGASLAVGLCAWLFFAEAINGSIATITGNPHLVKKVVFPVILLPSANVLAAFVVHVVVLALVVFALLVQGNVLSWTIFTLPFWMGALLLLSGSVAVITAGLNVVFRDTSAIAPNFVTFFFWATPVIWPADGLPEAWRSIALLNPAAVIIEGYRFALLGAAPPLGLLRTLVFAIILAAIAGLCFRTFRRLRFSFADAL